MIAMLLKLKMLLLVTLAVGVCAHTSSSVPPTLCFAVQANTQYRWPASLTLSDATGTYYNGSFDLRPAINEVGLVGVRTGSGMTIATINYFLPFNRTRLFVWPSDSPKEADTYLPFAPALHHKFQPLVMC